MSRKQIIAVWCGVAAIAFFSISGRIFFPAYRDVFHGVIVLVFLAALLTGPAALSSDITKTGNRKTAAKTEHKAAAPTVTGSFPQRPRKRPAVRRMRKRKTGKGRRR